MPPTLSRKRLQSDSPDPERSSKRPHADARKAPARRSKESVFQTLDAPPKVKRTLSQTKALLELGDDDSELSEPESSEDEFEDVPMNNGGVNGVSRPTQNGSESEESQDEDWEDALGSHHHTHTHTDPGPAPKISGDIALTLSSAPTITFDTKLDGKKGATKAQRQIRNATHCIHVQFLMFHNLMRNSWVQDKETQKILVDAMPPGCWLEIERYWRDAGISDGYRHTVATRKGRDNAKNSSEQKGKWKESGKKGVKVYDKADAKSGARKSTGKTGGSSKNPAAKTDRLTRDWGASSEPLEPNTPNVSAGDPLQRLMRYLSAYWKAKFRITGPSLRKRGYLSPATLKDEVNGWKKKPDYPDLFGEKVEGKEAFREAARKCEGSRDLGQELFTALIRGLGIEARMIVSLQPIGFGWSQTEEGTPKNLDLLEKATNTEMNSTPTKTPPKKGQQRGPITPKGGRKLMSEPDLSDSSDLSSVISISSDSDEKPKFKKSPKTKKYNDDMPYPTYWTEAISHLTHTPISVSPFGRTLIASPSSPDKYIDFYARGAAADKARQIFAYVIAFSSDGTAKDVTTRYLPKRQWPGRTKGFRMPVEKIPIHNKRGKVKRWEEWDWFKSVLRTYARDHSKRKPWDEVEDEGDLVPAEPEKKKEMDEEGGKETLQGYKNSAEYVLERHLRREEALKPGAKIVRHFVTGKGDNEKSEPVYRRKDIVLCKTVESWHKEGRELRTGEQALKYVPMRAVTVTRKREIEERERVEGEKVKQGLYSRAQTDWIIPDPIVDGKIPRNAFGNIDIYVPTMIPKGAVHIPLKGTAKICRKLNIDHAEACTGFEFGKQRAVPVLTGVIVAAENEDLVIDAWETDEAEKARKEAEKRTTKALALWRKFCSGLRIIERMRAEYGSDDDKELNLSKDQSAIATPEPSKKSEWDIFHNHSDFEGGFLRDDAGPSQEPAYPRDTNGGDYMAGGFFPASQEEPEHGDLTIDHGEQKQSRPVSTAASTPRQPTSLASALLQRDDDSDEQMRDANSVEEEDFGDAADGGEDHDTKEEEIHVSTPPKRKTSTRKRGTRKSQVSRRIIESPQEEDELSDNDDHDAVARPLSKRKAAHKSDAKIKSHFFADDDDETDLTDMTDRNSPKKQPVAKASRGRSARGRGRGKGRGRGRTVTK